MEIKQAAVATQATSGDEATVKKAECCGHTELCVCRRHPSGCTSACPQDNAPAANKRAFQPRTRPPGRMPTTAVESAGGGLGPEPPANRPPALSLAFLAVTMIRSPATNSNGCEGGRTTKHKHAGGNRQPHHGCS